jgi:hypothetical protein
MYISVCSSYIPYYIPSHHIILASSQSIELVGSNRHNVRYDEQHYEHHMMNIGIISTMMDVISKREA